MRSDQFDECDGVFESILVGKSLDYALAIAGRIGWDDHSMNDVASFYSANLLATIGEHEYSKALFRLIHDSSQNEYAVYHSGIYALEKLLMLDESITLASVHLLGDIGKHVEADRLLPLALHWMEVHCRTSVIVAFTGQKSIPLNSMHSVLTIITDLLLEHCSDVRVSSAIYWFARRMARSDHKDLQHMSILLMQTFDFRGVSPVCIDSPVCFNLR